jgi:hypothetical protein
MGSKALQAITIESIGGRDTLGTQLTSSEAGGIGRPDREWLLVPELLTFSGLTEGGGRFFSCVMGHLV